MARRNRRGDTAPGASALDELIQAERDIAANAERVAAECAATVAAAHADAEAIREEARLALARELAALRAESARDGERAMEDAMEQAAAVVERLRALPDAELLRLAERLATQVTGLGPPEQERTS